MRTAGRFAISEIVAKLRMVAHGSRHTARAMTAGAICLMLTSPTVAQQYRNDPVDDKARMNRTIAQRSLKDPGNYAADRAKFDAFFQAYYFPAMASSDPKSLEDLGKLRSELFSRYLWATSNEQLQQDLTAMAFKALGPIAVGKSDPPYHPAVRYNAMLAIGMLDEQYAIESGANRRPPKPLSQAHAFLVKFLGFADQFPPSLLVGALVGLERHAQYHESLSPDAVAKMTNEVLKIATSDKPIVGVNREVSRWIQLQAARTLAKLGSVGPDNKVHDALVKLITNENLGIDHRIAVASQLANIDYEGAKVDGAAAAEAILALARDLSVDESERVRKFEDLQVGGAYGMPSSSYGEGGYGRSVGYGSSYGSGFGDEIKFERRQVLARVTDLRAGMSALKPVVSAEDQTKLDAIVASINGVVSEATDKEATDFDVVNQVRQMLIAIDSNAAPDEAAEEAIVEDEFAAPVATEPGEVSTPAEAGEAATEEVATPPAADQPADPDGAGREAVAPAAE